MMHKNVDIQDKEVAVPKLALWQKLKLLKKMAVIYKQTD